MVVMPVLFQFMQQGNIAKIFLQVNGMVVIDGINFGHRTFPVFKVAAKADKSIVLPHIVVVSGNAIPGIRKYPEIDTIAPALRKFFYAGSRDPTELLE